LNAQKQTIKYIVSDALSAALVWIVLFWFRKTYIDTAHSDYRIPFDKDLKLIIGILIIPIFWIILYKLSGFYKNIFRRSRLRELKQTIYIAFAGSLILFFSILLDDNVGNYKAYYQTFSILFLLQVSLTYIGRFILSTATNKKIQKRLIGIF